MTAPEDLTAETAKLLNDIVPALMADLAVRGFGTSDKIDPSAAFPIPAGSAIEMVQLLIVELPIAQLADLAFNAAIQLAMVHVMLNENGGVL